MIYCFRSQYIYTKKKQYYCHLTNLLNFLSPFSYILLGLINCLPSQYIYKWKIILVLASLIGILPNASKWAIVLYILLKKRKKKGRNAEYRNSPYLTCHAVHFGDWIVQNLPRARIEHGWSIYVLYHAPRAKVLHETVRCEESLLCCKHVNTYLQM